MKGDITRFLVSGMMRSYFYKNCDNYCVLQKTLRLGQVNFCIKENRCFLTAMNYIYLHFVKNVKSM